MASTQAKYRVEQVSEPQAGEVWDWSMWIEANQAENLDAIQSVTYGLHPAYPNPNRVIRDPKTKFQLKMLSSVAQDRTWGRFDVRVTIVMTGGARETHTVPLTLAHRDDPSIVDELLPLPVDASYAMSMRYFKFLKQKSAFGYAREVLDQAEEKLRAVPGADPQWVGEQKVLLAQQRALCMYKDPSLPTDTRLRDALKILLEKCGLDLTRCDDPETLGLGGAIYKRLWQLDRVRRNLELAHAYYQRGYTAMLAQPGRQDYDGGAFTGANVIYVCELLALETPSDVDPDARRSRLAEADDVRRQLAQRLPDLYARNKTWWLASTILDAHFGLGCRDSAHRDKAVEIANDLAGLEASPWERQSTGSQLLQSARLQKALGRAPAADVDSLLEQVLGKAFDDVNFEHAWFDGKLGLALSGGGFRASLFHIGVLARLAEVDLLRHVEVISCVSGGSIVGAHYYLLLRKLLQEKADQDVTQDDYLKIVEDLLDQFLAGIQKNIRMRVAGSWIGNLRMIFQPNTYSRTQRLGALYEKHLYSKVADGEGGAARWLNEAFIVPKSKGAGHEDAFSPKLDNWRRGAKAPMLVLNATTLNTGRNWQFTASFMGEPHSYGTGVDATERLDAVYFSEAPERWRRYRLGDAVAASSCVPALFTPIVIPDLFKERTVRLVDGGVHDNQGTRALLDQDCDAVVVSDASGQMQSLPDPAHNEISVALRTNSVLQARVRIAQHQELQARERSGLVRNCVFLHLRKNVESSVQTAVEHATASAGPPPDLDPCTEYGVDKDVQRALSSVRTDLDSFTDREGLSLMQSGYAMATKYLTAVAFPSGPTVAAREWRFKVVAEPLAGRDRDGISAKSLLRHLRVGSSLGFKVWHLHPVLNAIRIVFLIALAIAALGGLAYVAFVADIHVQLPVSSYAKSLLLLVVIIAIGLLVPALKAWVTRVRRVMNPASAIGRVAAGIGMAVVGAAICRLHIVTFDRLFLRLGRVKVAQPTKSNPT